MEVIREITKWKYDNHDYMINDDGKLIAFRRASETEWQKFKKPMFFDKRYRKFNKLNEVPTDFIEPNAVVPFNLLAFMS